MQTQKLRQKARQIYNNRLVPDYINQHNQRKWVRSVLLLGDKWLVFKPMGRVNENQSSY